VRFPLVLSLSTPNVSIVCRAPTMSGLRILAFAMHHAQLQHSRDVKRLHEALERHFEVFGCAVATFREQVVQLSCRTRDTPGVEPPALQWKEAEAWDHFPQQLAAKSEQAAELLRKAPHAHRCEARLRR
jgi:hypothetical protein